LSSTGGLSNVVGMLGLENYGSNHVIFDAVKATYGNNTNSQVAFGQYPTLKGWNGSNL
jgi:hypothetical protein